MRVLVAAALFGFVALAVPAAASAAPDAPAVSSGDCVIDPQGPLFDLSATLADAGSAASCAQVLANIDLSKTKNLSQATGCTDDGPCTLKTIITAMAKQEGLPPELLYAVAWTETNWHQRGKDGKPILSRSGDIGLFQVNRSWKDSYDLTQLAGDVLYNARAGAQILKWAYGAAKKKGLKGDKLMQATYAIYNGGPAAWNRPWEANSPWAEHDRNFKRYQHTQPWVAATKDC